MNGNKNAIDPILQIAIARNSALTTIAHLQEFHGEDYQDREIVMVLEDSVESLNLIQRWFIRNPDALLNNIFHSVEN